MYQISECMCVSYGQACHSVNSVFEIVLDQRAPCLLPSPRYYASQTPVEQLFEQPL